MSQINYFKNRYQEGKIGDVEIKNALAESINKFLDPIRNRRKELQSNMPLVEDSLMSGINKTRNIASETMKMVREHMKIADYIKE